MEEYIKAKCDVFTQYMTVPESLAAEYEGLCGDMYALGERCGEDYGLFEAEFVSTGLSERYNSLLIRCTPNAVQMTAEQKKQAVKDQLSQVDVLKDAAEIAECELKQEMISMKRRAMIEAGVFDDYTRATNAVDDAKRLGKFLFGKKKK